MTDKDTHTNRILCCKDQRNKEKGQGINVRGEQEFVAYVSNMIVSLQSQRYLIGGQ